MDFITSVLHQSPSKDKIQQQYSTIESIVEAKVIRRNNNIDDDYDDDDGSNEIHNISVTLADQSIENLRIMKATGEITTSEEARRLKLLKSYLEYQRECDIEEEVDRSSRHPFLVFNSCFGWMKFFCRCYKLETNSTRNIDMD